VENQSAELTGQCLEGKQKYESATCRFAAFQKAYLLSLDDLTYWVLILYWALMEGSRYQASIGKMAMGVRVTDHAGQRLTFLRAFARNVSKFLSAFTFLIGFMMAGWTSKKQGLHDMVARCYVVQK
jgi:uncharacterized RDD family membrane protein YckC